jgi:hypothetical protein
MRKARIESKAKDTNIIFVELIGEEDPRSAEVHDQSSREKLRSLKKKTKKMNRRTRRERERKRESNLIIYIED